TFRLSNDPLFVDKVRDTMKARISASSFVQEVCLVPHGASCRLGPMRISPTRSGPLGVGVGLQFLENVSDMLFKSAHEIIAHAAIDAQQQLLITVQPQILESDIQIARTHLAGQPYGMPRGAIRHLRFTFHDRSCGSSSASAPCLSSEAISWIRRAASHGSD